MTVFDDTLLSRIEDASLNASAPPQQRWMDGWLMRYLPGKARRARCINAVAAGRVPLQTKLRLAAELYEAAGLPMIFRLHRFTLPTSLDETLAAAGFGVVDHTRVMVCSQLPNDVVRPLPDGTRWARLEGDTFAQAVGELRGSPAEHRLSHALRLKHSPVPYEGYAILRDSPGASGDVLACGQFAREGEFVGLYDVFTHPAARGQGLASLLCERLLSISAKQGASMGYLQVEAENLPALSVYRRLGFAEGYQYHYRERPTAT
jgi:GNAT superfamily N-acetyltransferase